MPTRTVNKGTTLLEILVVITIISMLAITSYLVIPPQIIKAQDARRKSDLHKIKTNLEIYYSLAEEFPKDLPDCGQPLQYHGQIVLTSIPCDPTTKRSYFYQVDSGDPSRYYRLYAILANTQDLSIGDVGCQGGCGSDCLYNYGVSSTNIGLVKCSYVCAPGAGGATHQGNCELFDDTEGSLCPKLYYGDTTCKNECGNPDNRCKNASGKHQ